MEHASYLRVLARREELERLLAKVTTDLESIAAALAVVLAGAHVAPGRGRRFDDDVLSALHAGTVVVLDTEEYLQLAAAACGVLATPTDEALSALRRALAQVGA